MWIEMTKTYSGVAGLFPNGMRFDLPEATVKQLKIKNRKCWKKSNPPWEDYIDREAVKQAEARQGYEIAKAKAELLAGAANAMSQAADACVKPVAEAQAVAKSAQEKALKAKDLAERKGATDNQKRKACGLIREHEKATALFDISMCKMRTLIAQARLKKWEAEDAADEAQRLAQKLGLVAGVPARDDSADTGEPDVESQGPPDGPQSETTEVQDEVAGEPAAEVREN